MPQPEQVTILKIKPVTFAKRLRHFGWISVGMNKKWLDFHLCQNLKPDWDQPANTRIFYDKEARIHELGLDEVFQAILKLICFAGHQPALRKRMIVIPTCPSTL